MLKITAIVILFLRTTSIKAVFITTNTDGNLVCPGEELTLTCTTDESILRWDVINDGESNPDQSYTFTSGDQLGTRSVENYHFTLISTGNSSLQSTFSTVVINGLNNARVECTDASSQDRAVIKIKAEPSPPKNLKSRSVEHHSNYSTVVVMWEPASNDSRVDFYQYQLINSLTEVRVSNTTNTTAILSGVPYNVNILFVISAYNCERESEQATIAILINIAAITYTASITSLNTITQTSSSVYYIQETPLGTNSPKPNHTNLLSIYILSATGSLVLILCLSVGLTAVCIWRAALAKKHVRSKSPTDSSSGEYDDIVGPIYETITTSGDSARDTKVSMTENEAYESIHFRETKFTTLEMVDLTNNDGNISTAILMQNNNSYQTTIP